MVNVESLNLPEVVTCQKAKGGSPVITLFEVEKRDDSCDSIHHLGDAGRRQVPLQQGLDGISLREAPSRRGNGWHRRALLFEEFLP